MERDELEGRLSTVTEEKQQLSVLLEQTMNGYQLLVEDSVMKKNDYTAQMGLVETELSTVREQYDHLIAEKEQIAAEYDMLHKSSVEHEALISSLQASLSETSNELDSMKNKYNTLRDTATNKLKLSAQEYLILRQREQEKDILINEMKRELHTSIEKIHIQSLRIKEYEESIERLNSEKTDYSTEFNNIQHELVQKNTALSSVMNEANEYHIKMDEYAAIAQRYKQTVLEQRERIRRMEKEGGGSGESERVRVLEAQIQQMRQELEQREAEKKELCEMVESLIGQAEGGAGQHQQ